MKIPQKNIRWIGVFVETLYMTFPVLSVVSFVSTLTVLYTVTRPYLLIYAPWVKIWMFALAVLLIFALAMLFVWVLVIPSTWALRGQQMFGKETRIEGDGENEIQGTCEVHRTNREVH